MYKFASAGAQPCHLPLPTENNAQTLLSDQMPCENTPGERGRPVPAPEIFHSHCVLMILNTNFVDN